MKKTAYVRPEIMVVATQDFCALGDGTTGSVEGLKNVTENKTIGNGGSNDYDDEVDAKAGRFSAWESWD